MTKTKQFIVRKALKESPHIIADAAIAENHPSTIYHPGSEASVRRRVMHSIHSALIKSGRVADKLYTRKSPEWPIKSDAISVLGYGAEKITYRLSGPDPSRDSVVAVYHLSSLRHTPEEVIRDKKASYNTYKKYFHNLVLPTSFLILDNPWGDGGKPAYIQSYIPDTRKFSSYTEAELHQKAASDEKFNQGLSTLTAGYAQMTADGICPDFASTNLLISGSDIVIFDTGYSWPAERLAHKMQHHPNYHLIESLGKARTEAI